MPSPDAPPAYAPHAPTGKRFADSWYCYLSDPAIGLLKVAFLTFRDDETGDDGQHGYVHVVEADPAGHHRAHDRWFRSVVSEPVPDRGPGAFRFEGPGVAVDEARIALDLPDLSLRIDLAGPHRPWFAPPDAAASPFLGPPASVPDTSHWFVPSLGTPATYRLDRDTGRAEGAGPLYIERGWSVRPPHGFCYLVGLTAELSVVLVCGMPDAGTEVWAGRLVTPEHDLTFLPFAPGASVDRHLDPGAGRVDVTIGDGRTELRLRSSAPLASFYDQITPAQTVFGAEHPVAKSMHATLDLEIRRDGGTVADASVPQSLLEFGGVCYPPGLDAPRPEHRYSD